MRTVSVVGLASSACVGTLASSDGDGTTGGSASASTNVTTVTAGDSDSGGMLDGCGENLLVDPGFEGGSPSDAWMEDSPLFGTPICSASCTEDVGAGPFVGNWWVWFGGVAEADTPSVRQTVVIPDGRAMLRFGFSINAGAGTGNDVFSVRVDEETQIAVSDAEVAAYGGWRIVELDISSFADGGEHTLELSANITGVGVTNFFVDEVELLACDEVSGTSSGGSTSTTSASDSSG